MLHDAGQVLSNVRDTVRAFEPDFGRESPACALLMLVLERRRRRGIDARTTFVAASINAGAPLTTEE